MMTVKMKGWGAPGTTTKFGCDVNISLCTRKNFPINEQVQDAPDVNLVTQAHVDTCVLTYNKVIISCRTHQALLYVKTQVQTCACVAKLNDDFVVGQNVRMDMCLCYPVDVQGILQLMMISVFYLMSKVFERIIKLSNTNTCIIKWIIKYMQIDTFMRDKLSKLLTGFRKNHSTQHCLMSMLEMWKNILDKGGYVSAIFMDLSKVFNTLNHNVLWRLMVLKESHFLS